MLAVKTRFLRQVRLLASKNESIDSSNGDEGKERKEKEKVEKRK